MTENIELFTQNSIRIRSSNGTIYIDPFRLEETFADADYILITHDHFDHYSPEDIQKAAKSGTILIVPEKMQAKARAELKTADRITAVAPGNSYEIEGLKFETVPAYNIMKPFHPKNAGWVGYILEADGKRIYIAGDTDATKEAKTVKCDIAMIPIGGTYTMNAKKAAGLINEICPEVAIPTHYGSVVGKKEDALEFAENVKDSIRVEIRL